MSFYAEFLKLILSNKRKLEEHEIVILTEECSVAIQNKLPIDLKAPNSFSIPYLIGNVHITYALCHLAQYEPDAPSMCQKLKLRGMRSIISLELVNNFVKYHMGVLDDVFI